MTIAAHGAEDNLISHSLRQAVSGLSNNIAIELQNHNEDSREIIHSFLPNHPQTDYRLLLNSIKPYQMLIFLCSKVSSLSLLSLRNISSVFISLASYVLLICPCTCCMSPLHDLRSYEAWFMAVNFLCTTHNEESFVQALLYRVILWENCYFGNLVNSYHNNIM